MTRIKLRGLRRGDHVHCTVFMDHATGTYANLGTLIMRVGEFQFFGAMLYMARDAAKPGTFRIDIEGDAMEKGGDDGRS